VRRYFAQTTCALRRKRPVTIAGIYALLKWAVRQAIDEGYFREELHDAELISETLWAAAHGVISLGVAKKGADEWVQWRPIENRMEIMLDLALSGLVRIPKKEQLRGAEDLLLS
jgi:hypothetical protein